MAEEMAKRFHVEYEYWLSNDRISYTSGGEEGIAKTTILVSLPQAEYTVLSHATKRYATTTLPPDLRNLYADAALGLFATGTVAVSAMSNDLRRNVQGFSCNGYQVAVDGSGGLLSSTIWATEALNLDWARVEEMLASIRTLGGEGHLCSRCQPRIKGFPLWEEIDIATIKVTLEAVQVEEGPAPPEAFMIPSDAVRAEKLEPRDLLDLSSRAGAAMLKETTRKLKETTRKK
jgi:hypothetical protein